MFTKFRRRRKSMGATTNGSAEKQEDSKRSSFLNFFKSRRRKASVPKTTSAEVAHDTVARGHGKESKPEQEEPTISTAVNDSPTDGGDPIPTPPVDHVQEYLTDEDVQRLFSGAPQFSAQSSGGRVYATVSFPWDFQLGIRDVSDAKPIPHAAYSGATLHRHLPQNELQGNRSQVSYDVGIAEAPSMLAATGNEPGTVGLSFFAQEPDADILNAAGDADDDANDVYEHFSNFELLESQPEELGIRKFDFAAVVERLVEIGLVYKDTSIDDRSTTIMHQASSGHLYAALFGNILLSPKCDNTTADPTGLKVQIETLIRILSLKRVWYDFSNVEWRIRVGQLLLSDGSVDLVGSNISGPEDGLSERDVVLLQLLLSCELYSRLEVVASLASQQVQDDLKLTAEEVDSFHSLESRKTRWDLVLAQRFLDNIDAKTFMRPKFVTQSERSLTRTLLGMAQQESLVQVDTMDIAFEPRRQDLQLKGLFHFAESLDWPDRETIQHHFITALADNRLDGEAMSPSIYTTPLSTPGATTPRSFRSNRESGYFASAVGSASPEMTPRSFQLHPPSRLNLDDIESSGSALAKPSIGGWLTRSYLTGLIMPGEAICHLLMSALLENDANAIATLGDNANLYGGFVYGGLGFWSKSSVVGRVIACLDGSKECMGWISSTVVPDGYDDGWLDISSLPLELKNLKEIDGALGSNTDFLAGKTASTTLPTELSLPRDSPAAIGDHHIQFVALRLASHTPTAVSTVGNDSMLSAQLEFVVSKSLEPEDQRENVHTLPLSHLVQFISAYPCTPPTITELRKSSQGSTSNLEARATNLVPHGHPLHEYYRYRHLEAAELLDPKLDISQTGSGEVLVVDARFDTARELLARAWCSSSGLNAVIARAGITCLGCAIRETRGLDVRVLIRVEAA